MQGLLLSGRYRLGESIGRGGMGQVWRAHDEVLHRTVAVKELTAAHYASDNERRVLLARTQTEARAAARVNHPAVVTIHDVLEHDDRPWIVMELVEGGSLGDIVKESGPLDAKAAANAGLWVLRALRAAHSAGVLHRDVKPANVLLAHDGRVLLTDFGIAQMEGDTTLTKTGEIVGSVDYLAPERVHGADPGPAADLWALGATLYTAVDGRSPFRRGTPLATMQAVVDDEPARLEGAGPLGPVIMAMLHKDPAMRLTAADAEVMLAAAAEGRWPEALQDGTLPFDSATTHASAYEPARPFDGSAAAFAPPRPEEQGWGHRRTASEAAGSRGEHRQDPYGSAGQAGPSGGPGPYGPHAAYSSSETHTHGRGPEGATAPGGVQAEPAGRGWRGGRLAASVVAAAVLVGGATAVGLHYAQNRGHDHTAEDGGSSGSSSSLPSGGPQGRAGKVPEGWERVDDPAGFSLLVPEGWERRIDGTQIDYTPDDGNHFIRISADDAPDWESPYDHQLDLERQLRNLPDYTKISLERQVFRDQDGALWEFTWTAPSHDPFPGPRHAKEQTYIDADGAEYAIYMSAPAQDWPETSKQFNTVLRSWRP